MAGFKDHFSDHASDYALYRPRYPEALFDYLGSGSKILALAEAGPTRDLIEETKGGICFSPTDVAGLRNYLRELIRNRRFTELRNEPQSFLRYDLRHVTSRLATELSAL